jgi:hypothetical protein
LRVGPLVLVGGREYASPEVIARFGGQKYQALVLVGHRVTVELPRSVQKSTSLIYADDRDQRSSGARTVADGHRVVDFRACAPGRGDSFYDRREVTFWAGSVATTEPRCVTLPGRPLQLRRGRVDASSVGATITRDQLAIRRRPSTAPSTLVAGSDPVNVG